MRPFVCWMSAAILGALCFAPGAGGAEEMRVEAIDQAPPAEGLAAPLAEAVADKGMKVIRGKNRTICEIWPARQWSARQGFSATNQVIFPFEPGQFLGVIRYPRKGGDFRGQEIPAGLYTMRYALQPEDGNHVGTSATRDFVLLAKVDEDTALEPVAAEELVARSARVAGTTHPVMLCLLAAREGDAGGAPTMVHHAARDLWSVVFANPLAGGSATSLPVSLVVVGKAE